MKIKKKKAWDLILALFSQIDIKNVISRGNMLVGPQISLWGPLFRQFNIKSYWGASFSGGIYSSGPKNEALLSNSY